MRANRNSARELIREYEQRNERAVVIFHMFMPIVFVGIGLAITRESTLQARLGIFAASGLVLLYGIVVSLILRQGRYFRQIKYVTTSLDVILLTWALWNFGTFRTLKAQGFLLYFMIVALASLRFSYRLTIYAGITSVVGYLSLIFLSFFLGRVEPGTIYQAFTTPLVSVQNQVQRMIFFAPVVVCLTLVCLGYQKIVIHAAKNQAKAEEEQRAREEMRDTLCRFVSTQVAERIIQDGISLAGEEREATILFCDIRNFTGLSKTMSPVQLVTFLNEYFSRMIDVIFDYGGTLDKFIGDALMAIFGAPVSSGNDEIQAVRCALGMRAAMADLNRERVQKGSQPIQIGMGIHRGRVVAGNIGSAKRMEYTVIGTAVNLASRIEGLNRRFNTDLLISEQMHEKVKQIVTAEALPQVQVRGLAEPVSTCTMSVH